MLCLTKACWILCALSLVLIPAPTLSASSDHLLCKITLKGESDVKPVVIAGVSPILKDENTYLALTSENSYQQILGSGVAIKIVDEHFTSSNWQIAASPYPASLISKVSSATSDADQYCTEHFCLIRSADKDAIAGSDQLIKFIKLPERPLPITFDRVSPTVIQPVSAIIDSIVHRVSEDSLRSYVQRLEQFRTRYTYSDSILAARDWLAGKFESFGCKVSLDTFETGHSDPNFAYSYNVVADHRGESAPEVQIVIGAHYDATSDSVPEIAPGADDNASGTAFCLEIARALRGVTTAKTVRFICFSSEEQWMVGSTAYASEHANDEIELMVNADMVGYNKPSPTEYVLVSYHISSTPYGQIASSYFDQYTSLVQHNGGWGPSDHIPFYERGFKTLYVHEYEFNSSHYHMTHDLSQYLDFEYMRDIVRAFAATAYTSAQAPAAVESLVVTDPGTGGTLELDWSEVRETRPFKYQIHIGSASGVYDSIIDVSSEQTERTLTGLVDGHTYYIAVGTVINDTIASICLNEVTGVPLSVPLSPVSIAATPVYKGILLNWGYSPHRDVIGYNVYKSTNGQTPEFAQYVSDSFYMDANTLQDTTYTYFVSALDSDSNESVAVESDPSMAAFFNRGLLVIDDQAEAAAEVDSIRARYNRMFGDIRYSSASSYDGITEELLGQYNSVIWLGDLTANLYRCGDALDWFSDWGGNMVFIGVYAGHTLALHLSEQGLSWFGIRSFEQDGECGFLSATGLHGWTDAVPDSDLFACTFNGLGTTDRLCYVEAYDIDTTVATPIFTFESGDQMSPFDSKVCGMYSQRDTSFRALIGFPVYCLKLESGYAILSNIADLLGASRTPGGDTNEDTHHTLSDAIRMIGALFRNQWIETDANLFDVNSDCEFNMIDVQLMLNYMYAGGAPPRYGCAEF